MALLLLKHLKPRGNELCEILPRLFFIPQLTFYSILILKQSLNRSFCVVWQTWLKKENTCKSCWVLGLCGCLSTEVSVIHSTIFWKEASHGSWKGYFRHQIGGVFEISEVDISLFQFFLLSLTSMSLRILYFICAHCMDTFQIKK